MNRSQAVLSTFARTEDKTSYGQLPMQSFENALNKLKVLTGENNPCSGCGHDHDAYNCWNNGNRPVESDEPTF